MAYVKQISIKSTPKKMLEYILNVNKTNGELVSGINTLPTVEYANNFFKTLFNQYYDNRYGNIDWDYTNTVDKSKKYAVKLHHFVQSFEEGTITPEVAHQLGEEWAKKCFGEKAVVVIATHIDKGHIHNHFAVSGYNLDGSKVYSNKLSMSKYRNISDDLCRENNIDLSIIEKSAENKRLGKKNTYLEDTYVLPRNKSWKKQIEKDIDVILPTVNSFEELLDNLKYKNYTVDTHGKYIKVKPQGKNRFVRLKSLSSGYDEQSLKNKILENLRSHVIIDANIELTATITKKPLRQLLKEDIDNAINQSSSFDEFISIMKKEYTVKQGTYIAFRKDGYGQSFLRSKSVGDNYDEDNIKARIEQRNIQRQSDVVQNLSGAYNDNIVSMEGLKKKQFELKNKIYNLNKKISDLSIQISQYKELKDIEDDYYKYINMPSSKMTILDTIEKQRIDLILAKNGINNKQEFLKKLSELETLNYNYKLMLNEKSQSNEEYTKYNNLIDDYNKVKSLNDDKHKLNYNKKKL